jgi:cob(I)alamin adenosyltransferase
MEKGYIQVYTGNGKGKTTASLGLSVRAAGAGFKVLIVQFMKQGDYSEIKALERFSDLITVRQFGAGGWVKGKPSDEEMALARKGYALLKEALTSGEYDMVVAEEGNLAVKYGLISLEEMLGLMEMKLEGTELIITGRDAHEEVMARADLVSKIEAVKHYFPDQGVKARVGIEK